MCNVVKVAVLRLLLFVLAVGPCSALNCVDRGNISSNVKLAVAPERAVAGGAASRTENHAVALGSRPFGSIGDSRI